MHFISFLVDLQTSKYPFDFNWPLVDTYLNCIIRNNFVIESIFLFSQEKEPLVCPPPTQGPPPTVKRLGLFSLLGISIVLTMVCLKKMKTWYFYFKNCSDLLWEQIVRVIVKKNRGWKPRILQKKLRSQGKVGTIVETEYFLTCYLRFLQIEYLWTIKVPIVANNWDMETYRNKLEKIWFVIVICVLYLNYLLFIFVFFFYRYFVKLQNKFQITPCNILTIHIFQFLKLVLLCCVSWSNWWRFSSVQNVSFWSRV